MKFEELRELVRERRTDMMVDKDRALDAGVVEKLCELAMWAPNHKLTFPWMFAAVTGDARERLSNCTANVMERDGDKPEKVAKARTKFQRAPVILIVGTESGDTQLRTEENRDAVSAGIQNILLEMLQKPIDMALSKFPLSVSAQFFLRTSYSKFVFCVQTACLKNLLIKITFRQRSDRVSKDSRGL